MVAQKIILAFLVRSFSDGRAVLDIHRNKQGQLLSCTVVCRYNNVYPAKINVHITRIRRTSLVRTSGSSRVHSRLFG